MELGGLNGMSAQLAAAAQDAAQGPQDLERAARLGKVEEAAEEFERLLATMLVKELRRGLPTGPFGDGPGADTFNGWFDEHIGNALAESGQLDLAGRIKASLGVRSEGDHGQPV